MTDPSAGQLNGLRADGIRFSDLERARLDDVEGQDGSPPVPNFERWAELDALIGPRRMRGWRYEDEPNSWRFGIGGSALLVADVTDDGRFHLFAYDDDDHYFHTVDELASLLEDLELANAGLTPLQASILKSTVALESDMLTTHLRQLAEQNQALER